MYAIPILVVLLALVLFAASRTVRKDIEALRDVDGVERLIDATLPQMAQIVSRR